MNYPALNHLNTLLQNLEADIGAIAMTLAGIAAIVCLIIIMFDHDPSPTAHKGRWDVLRKILICAFFIGAIGALLTFSNSLGQTLKPN
jgi:multisubunit Na+/H+ antiporter MnhB subunit